MLRAAVLRGDNVRVLEALLDCRLATEASHERRITVEAFGEELDRELTPVAQLGGAVDAAIPPVR